MKIKLVDKLVPTRVYALPADMKMPSFKVTNCGMLDASN